MKKVKHQRGRSKGPNVNMQSFPPMPRWHLSIKFGWEDLEARTRIYFADTYNDAIEFVGSLRIWGEIKPHDGGRTWKITI